MKEKYLAHKDIETGKEQTLCEHLTEASQLAKKFASKIGMEKCGELLGLIHDIGKYSDEFQSRINGEDIECDHATAGAQLLNNLCKMDVKNITKVAHQMMCVSTMSHHGGLIDVIDQDGVNNYLRRLTKKVDNIYDRADEILLKASEILNGTQFVLECESAINNLNIFLDLDKQEELRFFESLLIKYIYSCLIDADRLNTIEFSQGKLEYPSVSWNKIIKAIDSKVMEFADNSLNKVRNKIYNNCVQIGKEGKGFFKLTVPTGGGKTLASLRFATEHASKNNMDRIIYVLPYISIIEQNADVIRKVLVKNDIDENILVESHSNIASDDLNILHYGLTSNWSGQIIFTTMVQFLESVFAGGTQGIRRMHNMANTIIIFDEIQSMPIKCVHMANMLMQFLVNSCNSSIVLCSATQPLLDELNNTNRSLPKAKDIISERYQLLERVQVIDKTIANGYDNYEIMELLMKEFDFCNSVLVVVNTRNCARELYDIAINNSFKVYYLSTNLCAEHRATVVKEIKLSLLNKEKILCISTQLIEAGVDIDFECVFRYIAGLDSIIQVAGRCNREGRLIDEEGKKRNGNVYIINSNKENIDKLADIYIGQEVTRRILNEIKKGDHAGKILSDSAIKQYYKYYFYQRQNEMAYNISANKCGVDTNIFELMSTNNAATKSYVDIAKSNYKYRIRQAFKTAGNNFRVVDNNQIGVIVPYLLGKELINRLDVMLSGEILRKAQRYTVNVFSNQIEKYGNAIKLSKSGVYYLDDMYYHETLGIIAKKKYMKEFEGGIYG